MNDKKPVLLIGFNRPECMKEALLAIKKYEPTNLYFAVDGPRKNNNLDNVNVGIVKSLLNQIDWKCKVKTLFSDENLGCQSAVVKAINWFFTHEDSGIIIEDDVVPTKSFFEFAAVMLEFYKYNDKIKAINGFNYYGQNHKCNTYLYHESFYPWGWATWKRSWINYNVNVTDFKAIKKIKKKSKYHKYLYQSLILNLKLINNKILDTWDYQFLHMIARTDGMVVAPCANLIKNIGYTGAHSLNNTNINFDYGILDIKNLEHPLNIEIVEKINKIFIYEHKINYLVYYAKLLLINIRLYSLSKKIFKLLKHK